MCGFAATSENRPLWHSDPGIVECGGKFVVLTRAQARLFDALWQAMKRRTGPLPSTVLVHSVYAHDHDGGPLSFKTLICTNAREIDDKLKPVGIRVKAQGTKGYQLTFEELNHEMVA